MKTNIRIRIKTPNVYVMLNCEISSTAYEVIRMHTSYDIKRNGSNAVALLAARTVCAGFESTAEWRTFPEQISQNVRFSLVSKLMAHSKWSISLPCIR